MPGRRILRDGLFLLAAEGVSRIVAFSLSFVVARTLGLEELAVLTLAMSLIAFATVAGDGGLGNVAVADISRGEGVTLSVRRTAPVQISLSIAATLVVGSYIAHTLGPRMAAAVAGLPMVVACATGYVLQAHLRHRDLAIARTLGNLCTGGLGAVVVFAGQPLPAVALVYVLGALVTTSRTNRLAGISPNDLLRIPDFAHLRASWKLNVSVLVYMLTLHTYSTAQLWLASELEGGKHFVETAIAVRLLMLAVIPGVMMGSLLLPRYAMSPPTRRQRTKHACLATAVGSAIAALGVSFAPVYVPLLFGLDAQSAIPAVRVIMLHLPASFAATVLTTFLLSRKRYIPVGLGYLFALSAQVTWCLVRAAADTEWFVAGIVVSEWVLLLFLLGVTAWRGNGS